MGRFSSTSQNRENQISLYLTVQSRIEIWLDLNFEVACGTNSNRDFCLIWICSWLKSPHHSGFRLPFNSAFRVSSSTEQAVLSPSGGVGYFSNEQRKLESRPTVTRFNLTRFNLVTGQPWLQFSLGRRFSVESSLQGISSNSSLRKQNDPSVVM